MDMDADALLLVQNTASVHQRQLAPRADHRGKEGARNERRL